MKKSSKSGGSRKNENRKGAETGGWKSDKGNKEKNNKKRERVEDEQSTRNSQFRESKMIRKAKKPDWELIEEAKRIYNIVKPNDDSLVVGDREALIEELLKTVKGRFVLFVGLIFFLFSKKSCEASSKA